ncbi:hypothetical protein AMATHDRAFT_62673 [Amanita thiersii Skay4041]|uniref:aminodeoxychorismate synthase n=1 Tax=Amanita thiersii Skay4041 TaxID=703135 RepID=A0A2A9NGE3_9AGAR|nr:hypothetical protein AMATHDRAFT_62673 [Amanita thiersii Skay4041]
MTVEPPRILLIDSYDSFTLNLAALCRASIPNCIIHILKNDELSFQELKSVIGHFSAIIVGPGPGSPSIDNDIGVVRYLWTMDDSLTLPIFGVCLGLQSLCVTFGAQLRRLHVVKHGQVSHIRHVDCDLFQGIGTVRAVRYHSLYVIPSVKGEIEELAWADDEDNGQVLMACRHKTRPYWAVQYHPESACTNDPGAQVLCNFWKLAQTWSKVHGRQQRPWDTTLRNVGRVWPSIPPTSILPPLTQPKLKVTTRTLALPHLDAIYISEILGASHEDAPFVLLDSAASPGRFSIIASLLPSSLQVTYRIGDDAVRLIQGPMTLHESCPDGVWSWLANFMSSRRAIGGDPGVPFWGGLIGFISYEAGVNSLAIPVHQDIDVKHLQHPDINLIFVERSVVLDSINGVVYVQSLIAEDDNWLSETVRRLKHRVVFRSPAVVPKSSDTSVTYPNQGHYIARIKCAQEYLFSGDSYELCLTAHTHVSTPRIADDDERSSSWERYKILRKLNPAPHSAYLRLHPSTFLSSSPERFLSYSRHPNTTCQLRPIKGTVKKAPGITRAVAEQALAGSKKEVAENLMIVDLIRHDLHCVIGEDVQVKQFCRVEEYETVWQLVSVIEGRPENPDEGNLGWRVLERCLPPGSMTGAPKKRSVEILRSLEDTERSVYSGVFGYWCVSGGGDWSVTIRSCFKYDEDHVKKGEEKWVIGAGGAITALSDPDAEWDEMMIKLQSVLRAFGVSSAK